MHDIKFIRENPEAFDAGLKKRHLPPSSSWITDTDGKKRQFQTRIETFRAERKRLSAAYGQLASQGQGGSADAQAFKSMLEVNASALSQQELLLSEIEDIGAFLATLPNLPADDVPDGKDETQNAEIARWGTPRAFNFAPVEHADLGPALGLDFETGALISGSRFTFLRGHMARLQRALGQFMLDQQTVAGGYTECAPPLLVKDEAVFGTGQLPKFADDLFDTDISLGPIDYIGFKMDAVDAAVSAGLFAERPDITDREIWNSLPNPPTRRWLIPTAEVSLTNSVREQILAEAALPIRMTALTPCFRSEAGAAGKDTRGYIRQHQFEKVELVSVCRPEDSAAEHERMTGAAESILQALDLPYRKMLLCAGDMGFTARKTYDLEVWLPGQDAYREISSISNCGDFQARRMNTRYRPEGGKGTEFVHTLNGSGLAVGRTLVAVLENYQQADGSVDVPPALLPYMGGITALVPA